MFTLRTPVLDEVTNGAHVRVDGRIG